jgi:predicted Zn-dependent protease
VRFDPSHAKAWYSLAVLQRRRHRLHEAKEALHQLVRLKPDLALGWCEAGALYREMGQCDKALRAYQRAAHLTPECTATWCVLAETAALAGDAVALQAARRAVARLDPVLAARLPSQVQPKA